MDKIYIDNNNIYDLELLKNISKSIYFIIQNLNLVIWNELILNKYYCIMVSTFNIKFKYNYKFIKLLNNDYAIDKIPLYLYDEDNIYVCFNTICSEDNLFCPYWKCEIIKLEFKEGFYYETEKIVLKLYKN